MEVNTLTEEWENIFNVWKDEGLILCKWCGKNLKEEIDKGEQIQLTIELNHDNNKNMIVFVDATHPNPRYCKKIERDK